MKKPKRTKLEKAGWSVGSASQFLKLSREETAIVEIKLIRRWRRSSLKEPASARTQAQLAEKLHSSQSRVADLFARLAESQE